MAQPDLARRRAPPELVGALRGVAGLARAFSPAELLGLIFLVVAGPALARVDWGQSPYAAFIGFGFVSLLAIRAALGALEARWRALGVLGGPAREATAPELRPGRVAMAPARLLVGARWSWATLLCLNCYASMSWILPQLDPVDLDPAFARLELAAFGGSHPTLWLDAAASPRLTDWFSAIYALHVLWFFLPPLLLWRRGRDREQANVTLALLLAMYFGFVGYVLVPVRGPFVGLAERYAYPLGETVVTAIVRDLGVAHGTFPSLHAGVSLVVVVFARRYLGGLFWPILFVAANVWLSTLYLRYHYALDLLAGWLLAAGAIWLSPRIIAWAAARGLGPEASAPPRQDT